MVVLMYSCYAVGLIACNMFGVPECAVLPHICILFHVLIFVVTANFYFRIYTPSGSETSRRNANICKDAHRQDHYSGSGSFRHNRKCEGKNPRQRRHSSRPAEVDICWEAAGGWAYIVRLQHSERVNAPSRTSSPRRPYVIGTCFGFWKYETFS